MGHQKSLEEAGERKQEALKLLIEAEEREKGLEHQIKELAGKLPFEDRKQARRNWMANGRPLRPGKRPTGKRRKYIMK